MQRMKTIGILYICTGIYTVFWKQFYDSFEELFLPDVEKKYYVFTDSNDVDYGDKENVSIISKENSPWPLITLMRFDTFLSVEDELKKNDYLMFANSNLTCKRVIREDEILPRDSMEEQLVVVQHPGYAWSKKIDFPYERDRNSLAYIPWNCGEKYVIGALILGKTEAFLSMSKVLSIRTRLDLKNRKIAVFHDESHLNRFIIGRDDVRIVGPSYCYPTNTTIPVEEAIGGVDKNIYFDVNSFKNDTSEVEFRFGFWELVRRKLLSYKLVRRLLYLKDLILFKHISVIK